MEVSKPNFNRNLENSSVSFPKPEVFYSGSRNVFRECFCGRYRLRCLSTVPKVGQTQFVFPPTGIKLLSVECQFWVQVPYSRHEISWRVESSLCVRLCSETEGRASGTRNTPRREVFWWNEQTSLQVSFCAVCESFTA